MAVEKKKQVKRVGDSNLPQPSGKRLWMFRLILLLLIPVLFFGGLELGLRLFGFGYPASAVIPCRIDGKPAYCHNVKFGWCFFPKNISRKFPGFVFDTEKSPETYRVFILGASAAMGMPEAAYNFGRILEVMLNDTYPETNFEVITAAMVAINSHAVLEIAKDCARYEPDLFIVYLGNNEVVGPFGPGTVFTPFSPNLSFIRANIALKSTRTGQLLDRILTSVTPRAKIPRRWEALGMFLEKQVRHDSPELASVYAHFEKNLQDICTVARRSGARVIVSDVGSNLKDSPPFASLHKERLSDADRQQWETLYQQGIEHENAGRYQDAIASYQQAAQIDETFADLQFRLGRCCWESEDFEKAKVYYLKARQYDTLRFRPDTQINDIIRSVAQGKEKNGIYFVDGIKAMEANSPHQTPGEELFYEHVHLNFEGNYVLAGVLFEQIRAILTDSLQPKKEAILTLQQCAERLAYTDFERFVLLAYFQGGIERPPFTNQLYHEEYAEKINRQIADLTARYKPASRQEAVDPYERAIRQKPDDWQLIFRYSVLLGKGVKDLKAEEIQLRRVIKLCPHNTSAYLNLGRNLFRQGNFCEAEKTLHQLLALEPNSTEACLELVKIYQTFRDNKKLIKYLSKILSVAPGNSIELYTVLAEAYGKSGKTGKAFQTLYDALAAFPENETAKVHVYLGYLLTTQGKHEKAFKEFKTALKINPDYANDKAFQNHLKAAEIKAK